MIFRKKVEDKVAEKIATKTFNEMKKKKLVCKTSLIRDIFENTDDYELVARKEGEEFVIRVRKPPIFIHKDGTIDNFWNQVEKNKKKPEVNTFYADNLKAGNVDVNKLADEIEKQWERLENV